MNLVFKQYTAFFYIVIVFYSVNIVIFTGLYIYDMLILVFIGMLAYYKKLTLQKNSKDFIIAILLLITLPALATTLYQVFFHPDDLQKYSVYVIYNTIVSIVYIVFIENIYKKINLNYKIIVILLSIPVLISLLMYFNESINDLFVSLYGIERQHSVRHAGIWGRDVNQLGYYATVLIFFNICLYHYKMISKRIVVFVVFLSLVAIVISGMRLGIYVLGVLLIFFSFIYKKPIVRLIVLIKLALLLSLIGYSYYIISDDPFIVEYLMKRFDFGLFVSDLSGESGAHVGKMYAKWYDIFTSKNDLTDFLFSMYPAWKHPDSLIIFYFANHGLIGFTLFVFFITYLLIRLFKFNFPYIPTFIVSFLFIVSFKGNFLFNNMGMFLFVFVMHIFINKKELKGGGLWKLSNQ